MSSRRRLDRELVRRGLAPSRTAAGRLIADGSVTVDGAPAAKAASMVAPSQAIVVDEKVDRYASRAGVKLAGALDAFGVDPAGRHCLDAGASTGGFTDVLLRRGAERVVAVDVGYGQLRWELRTDERVLVMDRTNVRALEPGDLPPPVPGLVVGDLSFISLRLVLPALVGVAARDADQVLMVKPQFEVGRDAVGRGGVVRDPARWADAVLGVVDAARELGLGVRGVVPSSLPGPSGNVEFFVHLAAGPATVDAGDAVACAVVAGGTLVGTPGAGSSQSEPGPSEPGPSGAGPSGAEPSGGASGEGRRPVEGDG